MAITAPAWLTSDFLKSSLEYIEETHQEITITSYSIEPAVPAGNNYGSQMLRVKINYTKQNCEGNACSISLIIKAPLSGGFMEEIGSSPTAVYETEPQFYNVYINETYTLCKHDIVPKHYKSPDPLSLILEDLTHSGYVMADRHKLLDFDHCQLYVKASAKLHAMSVAIYKKKPELIESLVKDKTGAKGEQVFKGMLYGGLRCMAAYLEDKPDYKEYLELIDLATQNESLWNIFPEMEKSSKSLKALIQADPWCTNMMFKYSSSGEVISIKIFDFQSLKFTTPVREFITFIWVSAKLEVRETKLDDLCQLYCNSLNENLAQLGCSERLTFHELQEEIMLLSPLVLLFVFTILPLCLADGAADLSDLFDGKVLNFPVKECSIYNLYQGSAFNQYYPKILDQVNKEGIVAYLKEKLKQ